MKLEEIAAHIGAQLLGDGNIDINNVATLNDATVDDISFFHNKKYLHQLKQTQAGAVILSQNDAEQCSAAKLIVDDPYFAYAKLAALFEYTPECHGKHSTAIVGECCDIDASASIAANVVIGDHVTIARGVSIAAGVVIADYVSIGEGSTILANVTLCHHVSIGQQVLIHPNAVIGSDGFGNAMYQGRWHKVAQLGSVTIGNDVEIGANTTIDRGTIGNTIIEDGVRLDNQIQIGHNVKIGAHTAIAACSGVAGSTVIGKYCMIGGKAGISGHLTITDGVILTANAQVSNSIKQKGLYSSGTGLFPNPVWRKNIARLRKLDHYIKKLQKLLKHTEVNDD